MSRWLVVLLGDDPAIREAPAGSLGTAMRFAQECADASREKALLLGHLPQWGIFGIYRPATKDAGTEGGHR